MCPIWDFRTCRFYGGVLGLRLSKTIALPGGGQHFFFDLNGNGSLAWVLNEGPRSALRKG